MPALHVRYRKCLVAEQVGQVDLCYPGTGGGICNLQVIRTDGSRRKGLGLGRDGSLCG